MDSSADEVPEVGLTVVHEPKPGPPTLDVVFVHGFTGSPSKTWTHQRGHAAPCADDLDDTEPPLKARKLHPGVWSRTRPVETTAIFWPRDLLPSTIPGARVLTYGYDTHVRFKYAGRLGSDVTLYDIAKDLLGSLEALRFKEPSRPILFVCHSFGGIVIKEMLRHACHTHEVSHPQAVYKSTLGIMFFGTPHLGADPRPLLLKAVEPVARLGLRVNDKIVSTLSPNSADLRRLRDEFNPIAEKQKWIVYSFQEADRLRLLGGNRVVESMSSCLGLSPSLETRLEIKRDHGGMCRFTHIGDTEYQKVTAALLGMTAAITAQSKDAGRNSDMQRLSDDQREVLLKSLQFSQIDSRLGSVKAAHAATCRWFLKRREYLDWLDPQKLAGHHGFLWIKGKPGAGKSTLMKFALTSFRRKTRGSVSFFFNARGAELEKTTTGMYRSLLLQLLEPRKELRCAFDNAGLEPWNATNDFVWSVESLKQVFEQVIHGLEQSDQVTCFIDALDECPESEVRDMVEFFEDLGAYAVENEIRFCVLFSSRHYPHITISKGLSLVLEGQEEHSEDIKKYVEGRLKIKVKDDARSQIVSRIEEKASGVFMWVVLVVDMMNKSHDEGRPTAYIRKNLEELPSDLHQLFRGILVRDESHRDELLLSLQWMLFARCPLTPNELYCAIFAGTDAQLLGQWDEADERVQRFVLDSSKGLAEVIETKTKTKPRTRTKPETETEDKAQTKTTANAKVVQFIHESVRDFLLKEGGLKTLWPDLGDNFEDQSHNTLKECCLNYINTKDVKALHTEEGISDPEKSVRDWFPFLDYATQNLLYHADAAAASVSQGDFLGEYPRLRWVALHNLFEQFKSRQYSPGVTLAYILAEKDVGPLLAAQLSVSSSSGLEVENERFGTPLFAARATKSHKAALSILQTNAQAQNSVPELQDLCQRFAESAVSARWDRKFCFRKEEPRLWYHALGTGDDIIAAFLLTLERATRGRIHDIEVEGSGNRPWFGATPPYILYIGALR